MRRTPLVVAGIAAASLALAACGSNSLSNGGPTANATVKSSVDAAAAALVPAAIKSKGTLTVGMDTTYPPVDALAADGQTAVGLDVDLFKAVATTLGLKVTFQTSNFNSIINGVNSGKYDVGVSAFSINADRLKSVHMVSYFTAGTQWATAVGNPKHIAITNACGFNIAVQTATVEQTEIQARSATCTKAGKPAIHIDPYKAQTNATAAVISGKDDAMLADSPIIAYAVKKSNGKLASLGSIYSSAPYGFVVAKADLPLANAFAAALKVIYANGSYTKILEAWGATQGAITNFSVDPAVQ